MKLPHLDLTTHVPNPEADAIVFKRLSVEPYNSIFLLKQQLDLSWFGQQHACLPDFTYRWSGGDGVAELELVQDGPSCQRRRGPAARSAPPASTQEASPAPTPCWIS